MSQPAASATQPGEPVMYTSAELASFDRPRLLRELARNGLSRTKSCHQLRREIWELCERADNAFTFTSEEHRRQTRTQLNATPYDFLLQGVAMAGRDNVSSDAQMRADLEAYYERRRRFGAGRTLLERNDGPEAGQSADAGASGDTGEATDGSHVVVEAVSTEDRNTEDSSVTGDVSGDGTSTHQDGL